MNTKSPNNLVFFSSCPDSWGGSEELWAQAAELMKQKNYQIHIFKLNVDFSHPQIKKLLNSGCKITDLKTDLRSYLSFLPRDFGNHFLPFNSLLNHHSYIKRVLAKKINRLQPKLFVISQVNNFDGLYFIKNCSLDKYPYVLLTQKANDSLWINDRDREWMSNLWRNAAASFFVSKHNLKLTQEQFGIKIKNAEVVWNPFLTKTEKPLPFISFPEDKIKLACVARLYPPDKGQDILLKVLANEKWRRRNLEISFFGKGSNEKGLKDLARYYQLQNVFFKGFISDIDSVWKEHQALVLPSRAEGLPLALVEAMLCGRTAIVTDVGGNAEILEDNITGFISKGADEKSFDEALERAWGRRGEWEHTGILAADKIRSLLPQNPAQEFAIKLLNILTKEIFDK